MGATVLCGCGPFLPYTLLTWLKFAELGNVWVSGLGLEDVEGEFSL